MKDKFIPYLAAGAIILGAKPEQNHALGYEQPNNDNHSEDAHNSNQESFAYTQFNLSQVIEVSVAVEPNNSFLFIQSHLDHLRAQMGHQLPPDIDILENLVGTIPQNNLNQVTEYFLDRDLTGRVTSQIPASPDFVENLQNKPGDLLFFETSKSSFGYNQVGLVSVAVEALFTEELLYYIPSSNVTVSKNELINIVYPDNSFAPANEGENTPEFLTITTISTQEYLESEKEMFSAAQADLDRARDQRVHMDEESTQTDTVHAYGGPNSWGGLGNNLDGDPIKTVEESLHTLDYRVSQVEQITGESMKVHVDFTYIHPSDDGLHVEYNPLVEDYLLAVQHWGETTGHQVSISLNIKSDEGWSELQVKSLIRQIYRGETPFLSSDVVRQLNPTITYDPEFQVWNRTDIATGDGGETKVQLNPNMINRLAFQVMLERARVLGITQWTQVFDLFGRGSLGFYDFGQGPDGLVFNPELILPATAFYLSTKVDGETPEAVIESKLRGLSNYHDRLTFNWANAVMIFYSPHLSQAQSENFASFEQAILALYNSGKVKQIILQ